MPMAVKKATAMSLYPLPIKREIKAMATGFIKPNNARRPIKRPIADIKNVGASFFKANKIFFSFFVSCLSVRNILSKIKHLRLSFESIVTVNLKLNSSKAVYSRRLKNIPFPKEIRVFEPDGDRPLLLLYDKFTIKYAQDF